MENVKNIIKMVIYGQFILMENKMENLKYIIKMDNYHVFAIILMEKKMENLKNI